MTIYNKCAVCKKWFVERDLDYFTGVGEVCHSCAIKLLEKNKKVK